MKRRMLNGLPWLWLLLCIGTGSLWLAGHVVPVYHQHIAGRWWFRLPGRSVGNISIAFFCDLPKPVAMAWADALPPIFIHKFLGFGVQINPCYEIIDVAQNNMVLVRKQMGFAIPYWAAWAM